MPRAVTIIMEPQLSYSYCIFDIKVLLKKAKNTTTTLNNKDKTELANPQKN